MAKRHVVNEAVTGAFMLTIDGVNRVFRPGYVGPDGTAGYQLSTELAKDERFIEVEVPEPIAPSIAILAASGKEQARKSRKAATDKAGKARAAAKKKADKAAAEAALEVEAATRPRSKQARKIAATVKATGTVKDTPPADDTSSDEK